MTSKPTVTKITVVVYENRGDTEDWLRNPDTDEVMDEDLAAYDKTLTYRMLDYLSEYGVTRVEIENDLSQRFEVQGTTDRYDEIQEAARRAYEVILDCMGNDWDWAE